MVNVFIGIGSNLDQPVAQVKKAFKALDSLPNSRVLKCSSLYTSRPQGPQDQDDYVNAAALVGTELSPVQLLEALKAIEADFGRVKKRHWGERVIDLDIVFYGQEQVIVDQPDLTIPHREVLNRDFVILPILEIEPDWQLPNGERLDHYVAKESHVLTKLSIQADD